MGRYNARVTIAGIDGTLIKCEMGTTHTYLVFRADNSVIDEVVSILQMGMSITQPYRGSSR